MRKIGIFRKFLQGFRHRPSPLGVLAFLTALFFATVAAAAEKIRVFPETPYDGFIIYESLAVFWIFIIGLIVIIRMKLREIERTQALGTEREDPEAPLLE